MANIRANPDTIDFRLHEIEESRWVKWLRWKLYDLKQGEKIAIQISNEELENIAPPIYEAPSYEDKQRHAEFMLLKQFGHLTPKVSSKQRFKYFCKLNKWIVKDGFFNVACEIEIHADVIFDFRSSYY